MYNCDVDLNGKTTEHLSLALLSVWELWNQDWDNSINTELAVTVMVANASHVNHPRLSFLIILHS